MNKKAFTLVELLAVIVLIGLVLGLAIPGINKISKNVKKKSANKQIALIEQSAILWGQDNTMSLEKYGCNVESPEDWYKCNIIPVNDLIKYNYLEDINDNLSKKCVAVYKKNKRIYASMQDEDKCGGVPLYQQQKNSIEGDPTGDDDKDTSSTPTEEMISKYPDCQYVCHLNSSRNFFTSLPLPAEYDIKGEWLTYLSCPKIYDRYNNIITFDEEGYVDALKSYKDGVIYDNECFYDDDGPILIRKKSNNSFSSDILREDAIIKYKEVDGRFVGLKLSYDNTNIDIDKADLYMFDNYDGSHISLYEQNGDLKDRVKITKDYIKLTDINKNTNTYYFNKNNNDDNSVNVTKNTKTTERILDYTNSRLSFTCNNNADSCNVNYTDNMTYSYLYNIIGISNKVEGSNWNENNARYKRIEYRIVEQGEKPDFNNTICYHYLFLKNGKINNDFFEDSRLCDTKQSIPIYKNKHYYIYIYSYDQDDNYVNNGTLLKMFTVNFDNSSQSQDSSDCHYTSSIIMCNECLINNIPKNICTDNQQLPYYIDTIRPILQR